MTPQNTGGPPRIRRRAYASPPKHNPSKTVTPAGPDMATSGAPQVKTQLKQQKAREAGKKNLFKGGPIQDNDNYEDYDSEDLTEEQRKIKKHQ